MKIVNTMNFICDVDPSVRSMNMITPVSEEIKLNKIKVNTGNINRELIYKFKLS